MKQLIIIFSMLGFLSLELYSQCTVFDPITFQNNNVGDLGLTSFTLELDKPQCNTATITVKYIVGRSTTTMPTTMNNICPSTPFGATYLQAEFLLGIPPVFDGGAGTASITASNGMTYFGTPVFQNGSDWQVDLMGDIPPGVELTYTIANMPILSMTYTNQMIPMNLNLKAGIPDNYDPNDDMAIAVSNTLDTRLIVDAQSNCDPASAGLSAINDNGTATSWMWTGPGLPSGSTEQNPSVPPVSTSSGIYTVVATAANGCQSTDMVELTVENCMALPVDLVDFKAVEQDCNIHLNWLTASEMNNSHFEIEYSQTGKNFKPLTVVEGAGNSLEMKSYSFTHQRAVIGKNYYRLKQVDFDGSFAYSPIIVSNVQCNKGADFEVYPIPVQSNTDLTVRFNTLSEVSAFSITNTLGELVLEISAEQLRDSGQQFRMNIANLPAGTYFITTRDGKHHPFTVVE